MSNNEANKLQRSNSSSEEFARTVAAVKEAIDDMEAGDTGRPAADVVRDIREKYGLTDK